MILEHPFYNEDTGEIELLYVEFEVNPFVPATRYSPAEGGDIDDITIFNERNQDITARFSDEDLKDIEDACFNHHENNCKRYEEDFEPENYAY